MLKINGADMPTPTDMICTISDIDSSKSGRSADGIMHRDRIAVKRKLQLKWSFLTPADMSLLLKAVKPIFFACTYPDPEAGTSVSLQFYVGDRTMPIYTIKNGVAGWSGLEMSFIEK